MIDQFSYQVIWSEEDQSHIGRCHDFPSLSYLAETRTEALAGIKEMVRLAVEDMILTGELVR